MNNGKAKQLASIVRLARKYSLLGEYGNSLEQYKEAISIIKQRQEEIINENEDIKEKWKMTEYNIKSEMLQIKDILQICIQLHQSDFSYNKKQNEGFYYLNENKKIIEKEINEMYSKDKKIYEKGNEKNIKKNMNTYSNMNKIAKNKIKNKTSNINTNNYNSESKKYRTNKINPFQGNKNYSDYKYNSISNFNYNTNTSYKKSKSLKESSENKMYNPLEEFYGHKLSDKDISNINKEQNINGMNNGKNINKNEKHKKIKIVSIDLDKDFLIKNNKNINENKEEKKSINNNDKGNKDNLSDKNFDIVEQALQNFSKFNLDNTDDSIL